MRIGACIWAECYRRMHVRIHIRILIRDPEVHNFCYATSSLFVKRCCPHPETRQNQSTSDSLFISQGFELVTSAANELCVTTALKSLGESSFPEYSVDLKSM